MQMFDSVNFDDARIGSREDLLNIVGKLARHLAVELDMHYEDEDAEKLSQEIDDLTAAAAALFTNGYIIGGVVNHTIERFISEDMSE